MSNEYSQEKITNDDLKEFASVVTNFVSKKFPCERSIIIVFSQGGALYYAYCKGLISTPYKGLKDIDIWVFYDINTYPKVKTIADKFTSRITQEAMVNLDKIRMTLAVKDVEWIF